MESKMTGGDGFMDLLSRIGANSQAMNEGLQVETLGEDTIDTLTDKVDQMLPYPGIDQTRAAVAIYAARLIKQRDDYYREQGLIE